MEKNREARRKDTTIGFRQVPEGFIHTDALGRESLVPNSLIFKRKSGATYIHISRDCIGWPTFRTTERVKSVETGAVKTMSGPELLDFKSS